ncbi:MAG: ASCH domain-containing protein [Candidatus Asgardarchaeia archaeon]
MSSEKKFMNFDRRYVIPILLGVKKTTIRDELKYSVGEEVLLSVNKEKFAKARIRKIERIKFSEIDDDIAKMDGFNKAKYLKRTLKRYYPKLSKDSELYMYHFELTEILSIKGFERQIKKLLSYLIDSPFVDKEQAIILEKFKDNLEEAIKDEKFRESLRDAYLSLISQSDHP